MKTGPLLLAATISVSACGESTSITDRATNDCHRLTLMDAETGLAIRGAEDLTLAPDGSFIVVSAYDRWWAEEAARGRWRTIPRGATYLIPVADELLSESQIVISALKTSSEDGLDFRPHGLDLHVSDDGSMTLAVINRRYVTRGDGHFCHGYSYDHNRVNRSIFFHPVFSSVVGAFEFCIQAPDTW